MQKRILRAGVLIVAGLTAVVFLLVWDVCGWVPIPTIRGTIEARIDVKHGRYKQLGYGLPWPWDLQFQRLLRQRYGVEYEPVAGCIVSKSLVDYAAAYNKVSEAAVNGKYGHNVFKDVFDEAENDWERDHQSSLKRLKN